MKFVRQFEEFNSAKEIVTENDLYLILADFIEEDGYEIIMQKWEGRGVDKNIFDIAIKIDVDCMDAYASIYRPPKFNNKEKDEEIYNDIIDRLVDKGFYVAADSGKFEELVFFGPDRNYLRISITYDQNEIKNILAGSPSSFKLKN